MANKQFGTGNAQQPTAEELAAIAAKKKQEEEAAAAQKALDAASAEEAARKKADDEALAAAAALAASTAAPTPAASIFDQDINLSEGNQTTGVQGSLNAAQILALQGLSEPSAPGLARSATMPAGFYSVGKGSLRYGGKVYAADKIGGRFFFDPSKLPEGAIRELASYIPSGVVFALDHEGHYLDEDGERT